MQSVTLAADAERALALEHAGRHGEAAEIYGRLFRWAVRAGERQQAAEWLYSQARALRGAGLLESAEELAELCREIALRTDQVQIAARALNLVAILHYARGDMGGAAERYGQALEQARDVGDDRLIGFICQNLGVLANIRGDLREARLLYLESVGASVRSGDRVSAGMVYNNLGMVCTDLGEYLEAEVYFDRGIEISERAEEVPMLARLYANRAEPLIRQGDLVRARASLDRAEELAKPIHGLATLTDVARFRGIIALVRGERAEAAERFAEALRIADEAGLRLERAEVLEEVARLRWTEGRKDDALSTIGDARALYEALGAARDVARVTDRLARWRAEGS